MPNLARPTERRQKEIPAVLANWLDGGDLGDQGVSLGLPRSPSQGDRFEPRLTGLLGQRLPGLLFLFSSFLLFSGRRDSVVRSRKELTSSGRRLGIFLPGAPFLTEPLGSPWSRSPRRLVETLSGFLLCFSLAVGRYSYRGRVRAALWLPWRPAGSQGASQLLRNRSTTSR